jgi:predicted RNase H-like nuclease (RuvC/YqgF family)
MSDEPLVEGGSPGSNPGGSVLETRLDHDRLEDLEDNVHAALQGLKAAREENDELRSELEAAREQIEALESEVQRLDARTDLLSLVDDIDGMDAKQRSTTLIQHLKRAAERRRDRDQPAKASLNRDEAETALQHPDVDRTTIYTDMERAAQLVDDDDVLTYTHSDGEKRLILSLEGDRALPASINTGNHGGR